MSTFFTNGLSGNPYLSAHIFSNVSSEPTLMNAVALAAANNRSISTSLLNTSIKCATGTLHNNSEVTLQRFLTSPDEEVRFDLCHVFALPTTGHCHHAYIGPARGPPRLVATPMLRIQRHHMISAAPLHLYLGR